MPFNVPMDQINMSRDLGAIGVSVLLLVVFAFSGRRLARWEGAFLLFCYFAYMFLLLKG